ncbi:hypothetical protein HN51_063281, partial [Arachis hypogaea]
HISDIKLIRTDTTLDLSQKAEKASSLYSCSPRYRTKPSKLLSVVPRGGQTKAWHKNSASLQFFMVKALLLWTVNSKKSGSMGENAGGAPLLGCNAAKSLTKRSCLQGRRCSMEKTLGARKRGRKVHVQYFAFVIVGERILQVGSLVNGTCEVL